MDDVLKRARKEIERCPVPRRVCLSCGTIEDLAAEVRALRERVADLEDDGCWISDRCAACGHRFAHPSDGCAQCGMSVGANEPDVYPELCECPRCIVARNVAMDAAMSARGGEGRDDG